jgi:hypothetical protein
MVVFGLNLMQRILMLVICLCAGVAALCPTGVQAKQKSAVLPLTAKVESRGYAELSAD